ncbi:hypothetical protein Slin15195_G040490 [Septoria linicola]|uniref:Uncharacterized protein n=1 Tax=Septoria linicola TaxID=215465 RepID=A0A9Q9EH76_9PEZI|nr:hypothetical protein Slin14017_G044020 [Septoria linicola]USW50730.1 hypothetical protein Slin15195_G040490 [Septoria linicola]
METNTKKFEHGNGSKACSAAQRVFYTPELLKAVLSQLETEEFFKVQASHPHFMSVAMQFPALRSKFFLEENPAAIGQAFKINPVFIKIIKTAGWSYDSERTKIRISPVDHNGYVRYWSSRVDEAQRLLAMLPPTTVLWQPPANIGGVPCHQGREFSELQWEDNMASARVTYNLVDKTLRAGVEAFLRAHHATPIPERRSF